MKKVIIRCIANHKLLSNYQIIIFNNFKTKVYDEYINCGPVKLYLNKGVYKIIIMPFDMHTFFLSTSFFVTDNNNYFNFDLRKNDNSLKITVILVDKNYDNLPIERGEIKLWQDHTQ